MPVWNQTNRARLKKTDQLALANLVLAGRSLAIFAKVKRKKLVCLEMSLMHFSIFMIALTGLLVSIRLDRLDNQRLSWSSNYADPTSPDYQQLQWEANKAVKISRFY